MAAPAHNGTGQPHDVAARRFPLIPHPKPACRPLTERINRVTKLASQAGSTSSQPLIHAAEACNLAALIASDCGTPSLARDLCWQQYQAFAQARISDETTGKLALQPLINLARLHIRDGDGDRGYHLLESLYHAVRSSQHQVTIDSQVISLATPAAPSDHHKVIVQWLWTVLLSDGLRALCRAGRWTTAHRQAQQHNGIGQRLLYGRQIAILAHITTGQHDEAGQLLRQTTGIEPWEQIVSACLHTINRAGDHPASMPGTAARLADGYLAFDHQDHGMFTARLGLTIAELAGGHDCASAVTGKVTGIAIQSDDAYIAREILTSPTADLISCETQARLDGKVREAGLGHPLTTAQLQQLASGMTSATKALTAALARHQPARLTQWGRMARF